MTQDRSPLVEEALTELAHVAVTEACVSGLCDVCLYYPDLCDLWPALGDANHPEIQGALNKS